MFHFPWYRSPYLCIQYGAAVLQTVGLPHSEISGSTPACGFPELFAACRVLHRLPMPRHPSCALSSLTTKSLPASHTCCERVACQAPAGLVPTPSLVHSIAMNALRTHPALRRGAFVCAHTLQSFAVVKEPPREPLARSPEKTGGRIWS